MSSTGVCLASAVLYCSIFLVTGLKLTLIIVAALIALIGSVLSYLWYQSAVQCVLLLMSKNMA